MTGRVILALLASLLGVVAGLGALIGAATLAYYYRRRGRCARCGRGTDHSLDA